MPVPAFVKPCVPASGALMLAVLLLTVMVGEPAVTASVSTLPPLASSVQFCEPDVSPKSKLPRLRDVSSVTVRSAVMLM